MSFIPGSDGDKSIFGYGVQSDHLYENTVGHGVSVAGRTSGVALDAGFVGETTRTTFVGDRSITTTGSFVDFSTNIVTPSLTAGVYVVECSVTGYSYATAGTGSPNTVDGYFQLIDSASNVLDVTANLLSYGWIVATPMAFSSNRFSGTLLGLLNFGSGSRTVKLQGKIILSGSTPPSSPYLGATYATIVTIRIA